MSSCSPMLMPIYGIKSTKQHFPLPAGAILRDRHNRRKTVYYGRLPATVLLGIIILFHTSFIAIWMLREYYFFDFKCAVLEYELGSSSDIDKQKPTRSVEGDALWRKYGRRRGPRQLHLSTDFAPTMASFIRDWHLNKLRILKLENATSLDRKGRFITSDLGGASNMKHCEPDLSWIGGGALRRRKRGIPGELPSNPAGPQRPCAPDARPKQGSRRCSLPGLFVPLLMLSEVASKDQISRKRNRALCGSWMIRKRRSQQRANVNQFGRPVRPRVDLITSASQMKPVDRSPRNNATRSRLKTSKSGHRDLAHLKSPKAFATNSSKKKSAKGKKISNHIGRPAPKKNSSKSLKKNLSIRQQNAINYGKPYQRKHKSGESWESNEAKPTKKRFHFLSGPGTSLRWNNTHGTSWISGVIDPADENFSNKGDIRFYRGRLAKKKPKRLKRPKSTSAPGSATQHEQLTGSRQLPTSEERVVSENDQHDHASLRKPKNATLSEQLSEIKKKAQRKWKNAGDVVRKPSERVKSSKEYTEKKNASKTSISSEIFSPRTKLNNMEASKSANFKQLSTTTIPASSTKLTSAGTLSLSIKRVATESGYSVVDDHRRVDGYDSRYYSASIGPISRTSTIGPIIGIIRQHLDGVEVERPLVRTFKYKPTVKPLMMETTTELTEEIVQKKRKNFIAQLTTFSSSAICIARTLFDLWCIAECAAAIPFAIGIWCPMRCLFAAHIILDTLFLFIAFIYSITLAVYSVILYALVDDMGVWTLLQWLGFATAIDIILAIYIVVFIITLRCCELVVDNGKDFRHPRRISSHCAYQEVHALDGNVV